MRVRSRTGLFEWHGSFCTRRQIADAWELYVRQLWELQKEYRNASESIDSGRSSRDPQQSSPSVRATRCVVAEAENALRGLQVFQKFQPHLVTLDIIMPDIGGFTALDLLRSIRQTSDETDVVVISSRVENHEEFLHEGAIEFISKPFENFERLIRKLQPLIQVLDAKPMQSSK